MDWTHAFASTATDKLTLDDAGEYWITVKQELTGEETRAITSAAIKGVSRANLAGGSLPGHQLVEVDLNSAAFLKIMSYLVDWNLPGLDGKTVDISTPARKHHALQALGQEAMKAIEDRIDAYVQERAAKKALTMSIISPAPTSS